MRTLFLASVLTLAAGPAMPYGIKGVELDHTYTSDEIIARLSNPVFEGMPSVTCDVLCSGRTDIGNGSVDLSIFNNKDGSVGQISITFNSAYSFAEIERLLRTKYGKPTSTQQIAMSNAFGARRVSRVERWTQPNGEVMDLFQYIDLESGSLTLRSAKNLAEDAAYRQAHDAGI